MALQNCMDLKKDIPSVCSETCPASSHEGSGGIGIKTEAVSDVEEQDDPVPVSLPGMKAKREVSWMICVPTVMKISLSRSVCCPSDLHLLPTQKGISPLWQMNVLHGFHIVFSHHT
jgi:hypothetical protein